MTTALNALLEPSSTTPPKSVFTSVEKTQLMMLLSKDVLVFQDTPFTTKFVESAQLITSFKTITALLAQLTQSTTPPLKNAIALKDSF